MFKTILAIAGPIIAAIVQVIASIGSSSDSYDYSYRDIRKMSDDEWNANREKVRKEYCSSGNTLERAEKLEKTLNRFDDVHRERAPKVEPDPSYHWTDANRWDKD